jgi:hypothetical protein
VLKGDATKSEQLFAGVSGLTKKAGILDSGLVDHEMVAGVRFELTTFGLCDLTQLSLRVGLYLHPAERDARHPVSTPSSIVRGLVRYCLSCTAGLRFHRL